MQAYQKQKEISQGIGHKNIAAVVRGLSFLLSLAYGGSQWAVEFLKILCVCPQGHEKRLEIAEQQRQKLNSHPSLWLK